MLNWSSYLQASLKNLKTLSHFMLAVTSWRHGMSHWTKPLFKENIICFLCHKSFCLTMTQQQESNQTVNSGPSYFFMMRLKSPYTLWEFSFLIVRRQKIQLIRATGIHSTHMRGTYESWEKTESPFRHLHTSLFLHICVLAWTERDPTGKCYDLSTDISPECGQILADVIKM